MPRRPHLITLSLLVTLLLAACASPLSSDAASESRLPESLSAEDSSPLAESPSDEPAPTEEDYEIVTLLPRDAIPAIDDPQFLTAEEAAAEYQPDEMVLGVVFNGEARAYSVSFLSSHEIVNDTVGGVKIAVTW